MNFKVGHDVICIKNGLWYDFPTKSYTTYGPKYGEKCKIIGITSAFGGLILDGYEGTYNGYDSIRFRPLLGDSARAELISSFVEVTETSDCPINVPQTETICS